MVMFLTGCATTQSYSTTQVEFINLKPGALQAEGIAFITPTAATGEEEDKQALALAFTEALKQARPTLRIVTLPETLGIINKERLAEEYMKMYDDSRLTGIFNRDTLKKISRLTGARYLAQLKLMAFGQESHDRFGFLGLSVVKTQTTFIRLFLQIWDGKTGTIAWDGTQELTSSNDTPKESPVTFKATVDQATDKLIAHLPD
jgi:hypothetical protein